MGITNPVAEPADTIIEAPDRAAKPTDEVVRYFVETFGTNEHDAFELVLVARIDEKSSRQCQAALV